MLRITKRSARSTIAPIASLALLALAGCKSNGEAASGPPDAPALTPETTRLRISLTDEELARAVAEQVARDPMTDIRRVDVTSTDGVVHLTGHVDNLRAHRRAELVAETVRGVRAVVNRLEVDAPKRSDEVLTRAVQDALLANPATDAYEIEVDVTDGRVRLRGEVQSWSEKRLANQVARGVPGVRSIDDQLLPVYPVERADAEIEHDVEQRLAWDVLVDDGLISVEVEDGAVRLSGAVGSGAERRQAIVDAWVTGTELVDAEALEVKWWLERTTLRGDKYAARSPAEIRDALADAFRYDPRVKDYDVDIAVADGVVTLTGEVDTIEAKRAAQHVAEHTVGVVEVMDRLEVRSVPALTDDEIARRVKMGLLLDVVADGVEVGVSATDGVVTLTGVVDNRFEKAQAEGVAGSVPGVVAVDNRLEVARDGVAYVSSPFLYDVDRYQVAYLPDRSTLEDLELAEQIEAELFWSPFVDEDDVEVSVTNGVATLTGEVRTFRAKQAARDNAVEAGAVAVHDEVRVEHVR